jgi:hypothetical protein
LTDDVRASFPQRLDSNLSKLVEGFSEGVPARSVSQPLLLHRLSEEEACSVQSLPRLPQVAFLDSRRHRHYLASLRLSSSSNSNNNSSSSRTLSWPYNTLSRTSVR